ncbi:MAG TPA: MFS transporter [Jiangellales bacterium]|nr:MFS transporter [Jiangellales bacterium]
MVANPAYRRLWSATALSNLGDGVRAAALPLLAASVTNDPVLVGGVAAAGSLPWLVFGLVAGALIDRLDRRWLAGVADLGRLALLAALFMAIAVNQAGLAAIYVVAFACGVAETVRDTTTTTLVPDYVEADRLDRANGRLFNAEVIGNELAGPALGGYLFGVAAALPFALNGGLVAVAAALLFSLPTVRTPASPGQGSVAWSTVWREIADGVRFLAAHPRLRAATLLGGVLAVADSVWFPLLVLYVHDVLGRPGSAFGVLLAVGAAGGLAGAWCASWFTSRTSTGTAMLGALVLAAAAQAVLGLSTHVLLAGFALVLSSFAFAVWNVANVTLRQRVTPPGMLGRVNSCYRTLLFGVQPVGAIAGGALAGWLGLRAPVLLGVPVLMVAAAVGHRALRRES